MSVLWHRTAPPIPTDPLEVRDSRYDTVVVGAGITGLMTATLLARAGLDVLVIEAASVGALTTGRTTGKLSLLQGNVFADIARHAGHEVLEAYAAANREGQAWLARSFSDSPEVMTAAPAFTFATTDEGVERIIAEHDALETVGISVSETAETPLHIPIRKALRLEGQWQLHPMHLLAALTAEVRERGGKVWEHCRVTGIESGTDGVTLRTSFSDVQASRVVVATGTPIIDRGLFFARLIPSRSFVATYRLRDSPSTAGMHLSVDDTAFSVRSSRDVDGSPLLMVAGGAHTTGRGGSTASLLASLDTWTRQTFGDIERVEWWAAQDYRMITAVPFAAPVLGTHDRVYAATGFNKWGLTNGAAAALSIASQVLGRETSWSTALRNHHFSLEDAKLAATFGASTAKEMIAGWGQVASSPSRTGALAEGEGRVVRTGTRPRALSRVEGRDCEVSAVCPHMGGIVNWNSAESTWDCPLHGSRFRSTGEVIEGPALEGLDQTHQSEDSILNE